MTLGPKYFSKLEPGGTNDTMPMERLYDIKQGKRTFVGKKGRVRGYFFLNVGQRGVFLDFLDSGC